MALTASLDAPGRAGRPPYPANDVMARAGGDALALPAGRAGWAGWAVVPELAMSGIVTPATARSIAAITRKRTLVLSQPVCVRSSCMSTCPFMRSFGQAALRIPMILPCVITQLLDVMKCWSSSYRGNRPARGDTGMSTQGARCRALVPQGSRARTRDGSSLLLYIMYIIGT